MSKTRRQFGTWSSPFSPSMMTTSVRLNDVMWDSDGETLVWCENKDGRGILMAQTGTDAPRELTPSEQSVRGRIFYGGGEFCVKDGVVIFAGNHGRLYRQSLDVGNPRPLTPAFGNAASPTISPDNQFVLYVHTYEDRDCLAVVDSHGRQYPQKLSYGADFYMQPTWHPSGAYIAYIAWNQPNMAWDGTELHLAKIAIGEDGFPYIQEDSAIAGNISTAIFSPQFSPDGRYLAYISDATGWGQVYVYDLEAKTHTQLTVGEFEHGLPVWVQGLRTYGWSVDSTTLYLLRYHRGMSGLYAYDVVYGTEKPIGALRHYTHLEQLAVSSTNGLAMIASSSQISPRIISYMGKGYEQIHRRSGLEAIHPDDLAKAQHITWRGHDGEDVHGIYYPPTHRHFFDDGAPPLVVIVHGGPTSHKTLAYEDEAQFFATRGYAVLYPNHRGSTGYGRAYQQQMNGAWGIYDVEDSASGALALVEQGLADPKRLVIMGGSAGGFTALQSLVTKPNFYRAAVVRYGVANQFMLIMDTHKFEARYSDILLGALPDASEVYRERSPLFHAHHIRDALLLFQGSDDTVVPQNQSDTLVEVLRANRIPHEYVVYAGEGHGFRKPEHVKDYYERILRFLAQMVIYV